MFLAGALVSGVVVGRLLRGGRDAARADTVGADDDVASTQPRPVVPASPAVTSQPLDQAVDPATDPATELGRPVGTP